MPKSSPEQEKNRIRGLNIRFAAPSDAKALIGIYAQYIGTAITFEDTLPTEEEFSRRIEEVTRTYPYLVACADGKIIGYAYAHRYRERAAYATSAELSVYVDSKYCSQGVGKALYTVLIELARHMGIVMLYAGVTVPNSASERLHLSMGFDAVGIYRSAGYKCGGWRDVGWFQKRINELCSPPKPIRGISTLDADEVKSILGGNLR